MDKRKQINLQHLTSFNCKAITKFSNRLFPITSCLFTLFGIFLNIPRLQNIYTNLNIQGEVDIFTITTLKVNLFSYIYNVKFRSRNFPFMNFPCSHVRRGKGMESIFCFSLTLQGKNPRQDKLGPAFI